MDEKLKIDRHKTSSFTQISTDEKIQINTDSYDKNLWSSVASNLCPSVKRVFNPPTVKWQEVEKKSEFKIYRRQNSFVTATN